MMDIPALSMSLAQNRLMDSIGVEMLRKSLDLNQDAGAQVAAMIDNSMELSVTPYLGSNFDVSV